MGVDESLTQSGLCLLYILGFKKLNRLFKNNFYLEQSYNYNEVCTTKWMITTERTFTEFRSLYSFRKDTCVCKQGVVCTEYFGYIRISRDKECRVQHPVIDSHVSINTEDYRKERFPWLFTELSKSSEIH